MIVPYTFLTLALTVSAQVNLFARSIDGSSEVALGNFDVEGFSQGEFLEPGIDYCISTNEVPNHDCFALYRAQEEFENLHFIVQSTEDYSKIERISINPNSNSPIVEIIKVENGPKPVMNPFNDKNKKKKAAGTGKGATEGQKIEEEEQEEEEEDNRSFIQKNWMYIVPGLLILFFALGEQEEGK
ncbi:endoplasmic reticulum membrane protein complex subunit 10 [[Candida] anglica]